MKRILIAALAACGSLVMAQDIVGSWDFNNNLNPTLGSNSLGVFGPINFENVTINGQSAVAASFNKQPLAANDPYLIGVNPVGGNGGGSRTNRFSFIMDVWVSAPPPNWQSLMQVSNETTGRDEGEWFINGANGLGISGDYSDIFNELRFQPETWQRLAWVVDTTTPSGGDATRYESYINGVLQNRVQNPSGWGLDGRFSIGSNFYVFGDEDGEVRTTYKIASLQYRSYAMSPAEVAALGGPDAAGIVPEPGTIAALVAGGLGLLARRRRPQRSR